MRRSLPPSSAKGVAVPLALVVALLLLGPLRLWLVNAEGPLRDALVWAWPAVLGGAAVAGLLLVVVAYAAARLHVLALALLVVLLVAAAVVLRPTQVDVSESFRQQPGPRSGCTGWSFTSYPPGTMDAGSVRWCVGLEHPRPPG